MRKRFAHQSEWLDKTKDLATFALFWEQGVAKTRVILDTARHLFEQRKIDVVLVLAPGDVHRQWVEDEIPEWYPELVPAAYFYTSKKAKNKSHQRMIAAMLEHPRFFLAIGYAGFMTPPGKELVRQILKDYRVLFVLDESDEIKTPSAKRTISIVAAGKLAAYRRIMTGTPYTNRPFDIYSQVRFLDPGFWKEHGFTTVAEFKTYFGVFHTGTVTDKFGRTRKFERYLRHQNLDELREMLAPISSRILKSEVFDLPPKLYSKRYFELSPEQRRVYDELNRNCMVFLESGELITAQLAITWLLRAHQITSNYVPVIEGEEPFQPIDSKRHPRLDCLASVVEHLHHPAIIYARFQQDIDAIMERVAKIEDRIPVQYDGRNSSDEKSKAKRAFMEGEATDFVANPAAAGRGLTLTKAETVIYYNNSFNLRDRLQSEDRAHRAGLEHPVSYIDIVAPNTVDVKIVQALRSKVEMAAAATGDTLREWI